LIDSIELTAGFGSINLPSIDFPTAIIDRGFYFNGVNNNLTITGLVINSSFTVMTWIKQTTEVDVGLQPIFNFDSPIPHGNPGTFAVSFVSSVVGLLQRPKLDLQIQWDGVTVEWEDNDLDFQFGF
jgi:hypothetical protein